MEMEKFKELLNECNTQYEFVKLCDLEHGKKYEVTCFENINTKFSKKISVVSSKWGTWDFYFLSNFFS